jgi:uncharacterized membrane protein YkoI
MGSVSAMLTAVLIAGAPHPTEGAARVVRDFVPVQRPERGQERESDRAPVLSLDEAVARAERAYGARVIRTESREEGGRLVYKLRLLSDDGRVWSVRVDATTGEMR